MEVFSVYCGVGAGLLRWNSSMIGPRAICDWTEWHWKRLSLSSSGLSCQYHFISAPLVFAFMPLCQQDTPVKQDNLQTKQCLIFTTYVYFRHFSRRLSAHTNVTLPFSLQTYHQACEHNLHLFIMSHFAHIPDVCMTVPEPQCTYVYIYTRSYKFTETYSGNIIIRNTALMKNFLNQCLVGSREAFDRNILPLALQAYTAEHHSAIHSLISCIYIHYNCILFTSPVRALFCIIWTEQRLGLHWKYCRRGLYKL